MCRQRLVFGDPAKRLGDCLGGIGWGRKNFQHAEAACVDPYAIREGASGIDGDAKGL